MNYYGVIYFRGNIPNGKSYCFKSNDKYKVGDIVELPGRKKGFIAGEPVGELPEEEKIKFIVGKWIADYE